MIAVACLLVLLLGGWLALGIGHPTLPLTFVVINTETGRPVRGVTVRLREYTGGRVPATAIPASEGGVEDTTNVEGRSVLAYPLRMISRTGPLIRGTEIVNLGWDYWLQVQAAGYETQLIPLDELFGKSYDLRSGKPIPTAQIQLRKDPSSRTNRELPTP